MRIQRIQVENGFLSGLDLSFRPGLNVIIGARGTGKTSIIELLRFALGARSHTTDSGAESMSHARSILDGGEVTVTLGEDAAEVVVSRSAHEDKARQTAPFAPPIVFSQKEIESIGLTDSGRLNLLDGFVADRKEYRRREEGIITALKSLQREIETRAREADALGEDLPGLPALRQQLADALGRQQQQQGGSAELAEKNLALATLTTEQSAFSVTEGALARFVQLVDRWIAALSVTSDLGTAEGPPAEGLDPLSSFRGRLNEVERDTAASLARLTALRQDVLAAVTTVTGQRMNVEGRARALRAEVNLLVEGAGALSREVSTLQGKIAELTAVETVVRDRAAQIAEMRARRDRLLHDLDQARESRFAARAAAAERINGDLNPRILVRVDRYAQYNDYVRALVEALRGSNLKYNDLSAAITEALSPSELVRLVESRDFDALATSVGIPRDRAARVSGVLADSGLGEIAACDIEDDVRFMLLDGADYKDISQLSAGQRCTVILPIVLQHDDRVLIIDQPEDHIDNAFIADTLIKALRARAAQSQLIVSTHNANIPVLGEASLVIEMVSDGRQGTVQVCEPLEHPEAVDAITTVMEGGEAAFENRARFYKEHHA